MKIQITSEVEPVWPRRELDALKRATKELRESQPEEWSQRKGEPLIGDEMMDDEDDEEYIYVRKGITLCKRSYMWNAYVMRKGSKTHVGLFPSRQIAMDAQTKECKKLGLDLTEAAYKRVKK